MYLSELKKGESARILSVGGGGSLRQHFLDMGLIPGKTIKFVKAAPMGDPIEYRIWGYELTLRLDDAKKIEIIKVDDEEESFAPVSTSGKSAGHHPGLGEMGIYHVEQKGSALPDGELLTFGLAGNQNCGKTTLFN